MPRRRKISLIRAFITWAVTLGMWFGFTCQVNLEEIIAGAIAGVFATTGMMLFEVLGLAKFRPTLWQLAEAWRIPWYMISGTVEIMHALGKQLFTKSGAPSVVRAVRFPFRGNDSRSAARRALAITYTTVTPNFIVLGVISGKELMLYHQILPGEVLAITTDLGAVA